MSEPMTEAGRQLLDGFAPLPLPDAQELHRRSAMGRRNKLITGILAIEAEAASLDVGRLRVAFSEHQHLPPGDWPCTAECADAIAATYSAPPTDT